MQTDKTETGTLETWTIDEVATAHDEGRIVLIDVRTPQEYMFEHIEGALLMPLAFFDATHLPHDPDRPVVLHCGSGGRSARAAHLCLTAGYDVIAHMGGGFGAWKKAGKAHVTTDMGTGAPKRVAAKA